MWRWSRPNRARQVATPAGHLAGMRQVRLVLIVIDGRGHIRREAHGVGHRLPCTRVISRQTAEALRDRGVPVQVRRRAR